jgi:hypothetical protein
MAGTQTQPWRISLLGLLAVVFWVSVVLGLMRLFSETPNGIQPLQLSAIAAQCLLINGLFASVGAAAGALAGQSAKGLRIGATFGLPPALLWGAVLVLGYLGRQV